MKKSVKKLSAVLLAITILLVSVIPAFAADSAQEMNGTNWMEFIDGSKKITEITIPGTHDSCTQYVGLSFIYRTQFLSVYDQLKTGVRYFDMRFKQEDNDFFATHAIVSCKTENGIFADKLTAGAVIENCKTFLKENPSETILFQLKIESGEKTEDFYSAFYDKYIANDKDSWFIENRVPALEEARGKIVLLRVAPADAERFDDSNSGINFSTYPHVEEPEVINFKCSEITKLRGSEAYAGLYIQDSYKIKGEDKWTAVKTFLEQDLNPDNFNICLSSYAFAKMPKGNAKDMNPRLLNYNFEKGRYYGIVVTDFVTAELADKIFMTNDFADNNFNRIEPPVQEMPDYTDAYITLTVVTVLSVFIIIFVNIKKRK